MTHDNKNIWILNHYAITPDMPSSTRHYDFARELLQRGYTVTIFASAFNNTLHKNLKLKKKETWRIETIDKIHFVWIKTFPHTKNNWRRIVNMVSFMVRSYALGRKITRLDTRIKKPDVIIGSTVHLLSVMSAYWLSLYYHVSFIMEIRDLWPQTLIDTGILKKTHLATKILRILEKFLYTKAKKIITLSPLTKNYLHALGISQNKITLIPNGVDISQFETSTTAKSIKLKNDIFTVLYTGLLGKFMGLENALVAAKIIQNKGLHNIQFIFIGDGSEKTTLIKKKDDLKLNNVTFRPAVEKKKIPTLLKKASACLLITGNVLYGSENKLMDYMAAGKPIIFSLFDKHNNIAKQAKCGLVVPPQNPKKLAEAIIQLYHTPEHKRHQMGQSGRNYVSNYNSIPVLTDTLEKMIHE